MSNPISTASLKKLILKSKDPKAKIDLLLKTLPHSIIHEMQRQEPNRAVVDNLSKKLRMVEKLAVDLPQEEYGIWSDFAEEGLTV